MGLRVRAVLVVLSLLAVAALAIPLALSLANSRTAALAAERDRQLAALADAAATPDTPLQQPRRPVQRRVWGRPVDHRRRREDPGRTRTQCLGPRCGTAAGRALVDAPASQWAPIMPWRQHSLLATAGVRKDGELAGAVVLAVDTAAAARDIARSWLWVAIGCLVVLVCRSDRGPRPHPVGASAPQRPGARCRRDDRRDRGSACRCGRAARAAPFHVGVQHHGASGAGLARPAETPGRRRLPSAAKPPGSRAIAGRQSRRGRHRLGPIHLSVDDHGTRPTGESARAAAAAGPRRTCQRKPQGRSCGDGGRVHRSCTMSSSSGLRSGSPSPMTGSAIA